jgi:hypothetical protein
MHLSWIDEKILDGWMNRYWMTDGWMDRWSYSLGLVMVDPSLSDPLLRRPLVDLAIPAREPGQEKSIFNQAICL